ncbi:MAG TPA: FAD-dependent oxidoreductase [Chthoniobacteraceae bacterium]|jgi:D-amino-acid dehydrogenase|nr:FAD-dependent oxidoreductase [Chthoniobacteraceae bacterium]
MKHVVVVGGGVIGLSAAQACAQRGHRVTVIERDRAKRGSSFGNAGMIVPSHVVPLAAPGMVALGLRWMWNPESPFYIQPRLDWELLRWAWLFWRASTCAQVARAAPLLRDLHLASRALYEEIGDECGLVQKGLLMLCKTQRALDEEAHGAAQAVALGLPAEVLSAHETAARDPSATMDIAGSVYFPRDCHLPPERYVAAMERRIGDTMIDAEVTGWRREGARLAAVRTTSGEIEGDEFILAGGAWSPALVRGLGLRLPMQAGKGYSLTLRDPVELPSVCSILTEARVAVTPMGTALRVGGTMEIAGFNERVSARRVAGIVKALPNYYPRFRPDDFDGLAPWCGLRPCSPDGLPYLGRTRAADNLIVATGHAMMGLSLAPITGALVAQLADREPPLLDLTLLAPDRYA